VEQTLQSLTVVLRLLSYRSGGKGRNIDDELAWFDLSIQMVKEIGYKYPTKLCRSRVMIYKESILPNGGISS